MTQNQSRPSFISLYCFVALFLALLFFSQRAELHPLSRAHSDPIPSNQNQHRAIMSDEGEKTCPLCAEEMDLTDQQLKPCKCGYDICVWCWHHIMDMAEKDDSEGRCPACRSPYNKEKIVGMTANCERLVAEMSMEKKFRSQKGKSKTYEGRKQLISVRVIQRNLVYIVGLPLHLADEDLLQHREYFGQYGKVLKASISRTATGAIQNFANNTCSVYITYSKEEEAVRCIQSVHGFILDARPLRACFGTTKYCHAWLRNVPCSNPDCLYLHEIGSQEDSFTKDEIISAYTRSRVQQIMGATNCMQQRSGNVLPPPADENCNNSFASSGKPISKTAANQNLTAAARISPPNSSSGRSVALPAGASWGTRSLTNHPTSGSLPSSNGPLKQKQDASNGPVTFSTALACSNTGPPLHSDVMKTIVPGKENSSTEEESKLTSEIGKRYFVADHQTSVSAAPAIPCHSPPVNPSCKLDPPPSAKEKEELVDLPPNVNNSISFSSESCLSSSMKDIRNDTDEQINNLSSDKLLTNVDGHRGQEPGHQEQLGEPISNQNSEKAGGLVSDICNSNVNSGIQTASHNKDDALSFNDQRLKNPEVVTDCGYLPKFSQSIHSADSFSLQLNDSFNVDDDVSVVDRRVELMPQSSSTPVLCSGYPEKHINSFSSLGNNSEPLFLLSPVEKTKDTPQSEIEEVSLGQNGTADIGESSIISNILSLDLDSWDESLTSPQNLAKLLGETNKRHDTQSVSSSWKVQQSNQSRFSFAREESVNQSVDTESSLSYMEQAFKSHSFGSDFANKTSLHVDKLRTQNGFFLGHADELDTITDSHSYFNSNKLPISRSQVSAPPGFSVPNRAPPPGFTSHERIEQQTMNSFSGHHMFDAAMLRNQYQQLPQAGNVVSNGDIEFIDPAILAVGKGRFADGLSGSGLDIRSNFSPQLNSFENDARLQLLMQRSLTSHQNQRFEMGDTFSSVSDSFRVPARVMEQSLASNLSPFSQVSLPQSRNALMSNGHWDSWNGIQGGNNLGMAELLRPDVLGYNKFYTGYEDSKLRMPSQGDLYYRTFGM